MRKENILRTIMAQKETESGELLILDQETALLLEQYRAATGLDIHTVMKMAIDAIYRHCRSVPDAE